MLLFRALIAIVSYMFGLQNLSLSPNRKLWHKQNRRGACLWLSFQGDREEEMSPLLESKTLPSAHKKKKKTTLKQ